jgi:hypothetical protein
MRLAIHQPNYAPWCGYFAKMRQSDIFVFLDDAQMPGKQSYVYRTRIRKDRDKTQWLSVPTRFGLGDPIQEVQFADPKWPSAHMGKLRAVYARCPYFKEVLALLEPLYNDPGRYLSPFNQSMIRGIADYIGLKCRFELSSQLRPEGRGDDRLISLARIFGADTYMSGKGGQNYQNPAKFAAAGIKLEIQSYFPIPYDQVQGEFLPGLSILDALFHLGKRTIDLLEYPNPACSSYSS